MENLHPDKSPNVLIIIDGQNLYKSLSALGIKERQVKWSEFFLSLALWCGGRHWRAVWIRPKKLVPVSTGKVVNQTEAWKWFKHCERQFTRIAQKYVRLEASFPEIEICKSGVVQADLSRQRYEGEKGVDGALVAQMVEAAIEKDYEHFVLLSGDLDMLPGVEAAQKRGITVHLVDFKHIQSASKALKKQVDHVIPVKHQDIPCKTRVRKMRRKEDKKIHSMILGKLGMSA